MTALKALKVKFHEIPQGGIDYDFSQATGELNSFLTDLLGDAPIYHAIMNLRPAESMVQVRGNISGELVHTCSRCAEEFRQNYDKAFTTALYKSEDNIKDLTAFDEIEGSFDLEFLEGTDIDLAEIVHEQVALEMPFKPLCQDQCKGLCSNCGTNLNFSLCSCLIERDPLKRSPFEELRKLRGDS